MQSRRQTRFEHRITIDIISCLFIPLYLLCAFKVCISLRSSLQLLHRRRPVFCRLCGRRHPRAVRIANGARDAVQAQSIKARFAVHYLFGRPLKCAACLRGARAGWRGLRAGTVIVALGLGLLTFRQQGKSVRVDTGAKRQVLDKERPEEGVDFLRCIKISCVRVCVCVGRER
jgi:hypothetical protein